MLDINLFRVDRGGNPDLVRESQKRRNADVGLVDKVLEFDKQWRTTRYELDNISQERNQLNKKLGEIMKSKRKDPTIDADGAEADKIKKSKAALASRETVAKAQLAEIEGARDNTLGKIGNLVHESVPVAFDEEENNIERIWPDIGEKPAGKPLNHVDLLYMIGGVEYERGVLCSGNRGYYLMGPGVMLNLALIQYGIKFLSDKDYTPVQPPYFMVKEQMGKCAQLDDFDEQLYKVQGDGNDKYLIATSEQPLCVYHLNEWVPEKELPRRFVGFSTNFRKEAGSHGRDQLGIFRVHQFDKLEQFVVTKPEDNESWDELENMISNAEEFYKSLNLPYRVVSIVSGALNDAAAKKYDLEGFFPGAKDGGEYRELVSASNCTDYQARRLETRCGIKKMSEMAGKRYVHMLNSTLCATTRVICCILENYQTDEGIIVPEVLRPYMGGTEILKFVKDKPKLKETKPKKK